MRIIISVIAVSLLSGCAIMSNKQFQKQQDLWQNIGRMAGYLECSQQIVALQAQELITEKEKTNVEHSKQD